MDVHYNEEHKLEQFQWVLRILTYIQSRNDSTKPRHSNDLQKTEHGENSIFFLRKNVQ